MAMATEHTSASDIEHAITASDTNALDTTEMFAAENQTNGVKSAEDLKPSASPSTTSPSIPFSPTPRPTSSSKSSSSSPPSLLSSSIVVFSQRLINHIETPEVRLPPNFVGVRTVRVTGSKSKPKGGYQKNSNNNRNKRQQPTIVNSSSVNEDIQDDSGGSGSNEDRNKRSKPDTIDGSEDENDCNMDKMEEEKEDTNDETIIDDGEGAEVSLKDSLSTKIDVANTNSRSGSTDTSTKDTSSGNGDSIQYHQLPINARAIEEEMAEFQQQEQASGSGAATTTTLSSSSSTTNPKAGMRLPVVLSPPMSLQAMTSSASSSSSSLPFSTKTRRRQPTNEAAIEEEEQSNKSNNNVGTDSYIDSSNTSSVLSYDHHLSQLWSDKLQADSIDIAEQVRSAENMRPLAYKLHPEPWQRMRLRQTPPKPAATAPTEGTLGGASTTTAATTTNGSINTTETTSASGGSSHDNVTANISAISISTTDTTTTAPTTNSIQEPTVESLHGILIRTSTRSLHDVVIDHPDSRCAKQETSSVGGKGRHRDEVQDAKQKKREEASPPSSLPFRVPAPSDWAIMTCRTSSIRSMSSASSNTTDGGNLHHDIVLSVIFEYLHTQTPFHVSCGAKFGCDYLIYDGPRNVRHAFAGLKVLTASTTSPLVDVTVPSSTTTSSSSNDDVEGEMIIDSTTTGQGGGGVEEDSSSLSSSPSASTVVSLPLPTAYSLTSFVRCLNTAGKLALIATVVSTNDRNDNNKDTDRTTNSSRRANEAEAGEEEGGRKYQRTIRRNGRHYRVLFVDIALEKVLDAPTHKRKLRRQNNNQKSGSSPSQPGQTHSQEQQVRKDMSKNLDKH